MMLPISTGRSLRSRVGTCALVALSISSAAPVAAQTTRSFAKPEAEFSEPFSQIVGVRELKDGRVVVADLKDKVVQLVDLKSGVASKIGREGSGPGEYALPVGLFALPADTTLILTCSTSAICW